MKTNKFCLNLFKKTNFALFDQWKGWKWFCFKVLFWELNCITLSWKLVEKTFLTRHQSHNVLKKQFTVPVYPDPSWRRKIDVGEFWTQCLEPRLNKWATRLLMSRFKAGRSFWVKIRTGTIVRAQTSDPNSSKSGKNSSQFLGKMSRLNSAVKALILCRPICDTWKSDSLYKSWRIFNLKLNKRSEQKVI